MKVYTTELEGVLIIEPEVHGDKRGYFLESFNQKEFDMLVTSYEDSTMVPGRSGEKTRSVTNSTVFVQDNESKSRYGVVRGLHFQRAPFAQAKLVRAVSGKILDVAVDIRRSSPTFGRHVKVELSGQNHLQLFIPRGFAHGFSTLSKEAVLSYKCDAFYNSEAESGIAWNDPAIDIDWGLPHSDIILSEKDTHRPSLSESEDLFE